MHNLKWRTASAVAALGIGIIGGGIISAQAAAIQIEKQRAQHATGVLTMPAGDSNSAAADSAAGALFESPRLSAVPDAELLQLKGLGGGAADGPDGIGEAP